jgi:predicted RNA-binding Zn-ribbon protein involved in translation (DUF1610 family)
MPNSAPNAVRSIRVLAIVTDFIIEHQCPQCGAPAELEESDRFFRCEFCRTSSYLTTTGVFRYRLPHHAPANEKIVYFPYWRFKGMLFSCLPREMKKRFVDVSQQAIATPHFPLSLGFRSQTQNLCFAAADDAEAVFIKPRLSVKELLLSLTQRFSANLPKPILHQEFIGETLSLIYAPYYLKGKVIDAVLNEPLSLGDASAVEDLMSHAEEPRWPITFIPALCPQCGWDLKGQKDALALGCDNCKRIWRTRQGQLTDIRAVHLPGPDQDTVNMPFWRIRANTAPLTLNTYADLVKTANLPKAPQPDWDERPFYYWAPAFKVRPQNFLTLATALTLAQPGGEMHPGQPEGKSHAVNLPLKEAVESLKLNLAGFMRPRERMVEQIGRMQIQARSFKLVFIPFQASHHELIHDGMKLAINKNMLAHAKNL